MKIKLLYISLLSLLLTSCYTEVIEDHYVTNTTTNTVSQININTLLNTYELWYVDINKTKGYGEVPFLQTAFTLSFNNGVLYANNNLVGIGKQGDGYGIPVGNYNAYKMILDVEHDLDGLQTFDVFKVDYNTIELYNPSTRTSYLLNGYQRYNFDYDFVFYDNIHYFLQEYEAWEKTYTSKEGAINEFDNENYLRFLSANNDIVFKSSKDDIGQNPKLLVWDYEGIYNIQNVTNNMYLKHLSLDYDYFSDNEYFELKVLNDSTIELFHPASGTLYEFKGRGYIQYLRLSADAAKNKPLKKRKQYTKKIKNNRD